MEKKQTAVEFYRTEFSALLSMKESKFQTENEIFEKAKQMEKEQIIEAFNIGEFEGVIRSDKRNGTDYYNETYGGQDE